MKKKNGMKMKIKDFLTFDYLVLAQFIGFLMFWFLSNNPYKSVILYFSFMVFFCYWLIKIVFSKELSTPKNKKV